MCHVLVNAISIIIELAMITKIDLVLLFLLVLASSQAQANNVDVNSVEELKTYLCGNNTLSSDITLNLRNITYPIQPGKFCLVRDLVNISIIGPATVECTGSGSGDANVRTGFVFRNILGLIIKDVVFVGCGGVITNESYTINGVPLIYSGPSLQAVILLNSCWNVSLENIEVVNYWGYAILSVNVFGNSVFDRLTIHHSNTNNNGDRNITVSDGFAQSGGGMMVYFVDEDYQDPNNTSGDQNVTAATPVVDHFVTIQNSVFANNTNLYPNDLINANNLRSFVEDSKLEPFPLGGAGGLSVVTLQLFFNVQVNVMNSNITDNLGSIGAGVKILQRNTINRSLIKFQGCLIRNNSLLNAFSRGAGIQILLVFSFVRLNQLSKLHNLVTNEYDILIKDTVLADHTSSDGAAVWISSSPQNISSITIVFRNVSFIGNKNKADEDCDCILAVSEKSAYFYRPLLYLHLDQICIEPSQRTEEQPGTAGTAIVINLGGVYINGTKDNPSIFQNNQNSAIKAFNTDVYLFGTLIFRDNRALSGAALSLNDGSYLFLSEKVDALFCNNKAQDNGGAIYIEPARSLQCVVQILTRDLLFNNALVTDSKEDLSEFDLNVTFIDNEATIGRSLYGGPLYNCGGFRDSIIQLPYNEVEAVYSSLFDFKYANKTVSYFDEFRSTPVKLCFCNESSDIFECLNTTSIEVLPGLVFPLSLSPVDGVNQPVDGVMVTRLPPDIGVCFDNKEKHIFKVFNSGMCERVEYTIIGSENVTVKLDLILQNSFSSTTMSISIHILPCPPGFVLSNTTGMCDCNELYQMNGVMCNITSRLIQRRQMEWIGLVSEGGSEQAAIVATCPYGYCDFKFGEYVNISDPASICQGGRTGVLCGVCAEGLSAMFGTTDCGECSNYYLFTILMYAVAGVLLIMALFLFNITITGGTINGLVFYAQLMETTLTTVGNSTTRLIVVFISLLNLDLGFPVCFYDGMDDLVKIGLQFVFPLYIWLLVIIIIVATQHSSRLQKVFGNNACVRVLVTLVYLSFAKLIRTITLILVPAILQTYSSDNPSRRVVWFFDGSVLYFRGWHVFLILLSVLFGILVLTYQFTLVLTYFCGLRAGRLNVYLKPVIDAHSAPFKDKFRFWIGFRLFFIEILTVLTITLSAKYFSLVLFLHFVLLLLLTVTEALVAPFKNKLLNLIDLFFLMNINLYVGSELFVLTFRTNRFKTVVFQNEILDIIFVGSVMIVASCILIYHIVFASGCFQKVSDAINTWKKKTKFHSITPKVTTTEVTMLDEYDLTLTTNPILQLQGHRNFHSSDLYRLRESLLED